MLPHLDPRMARAPAYAPPPMGAYQGAMNLPGGFNEFYGQDPRFKDVAGTPTYGAYAHGPGGLFSYPGISRPVFSAMVLPTAGLQARLPVLSSQDMNPLYSIITGVTGTTGSEPSGVCDDFPVAGLSKLCTHTFVYGRMGRNTPVADLTKFGRTTNRGEFMDLQFQNTPVIPNTGSFVPTVPGAQPADILRSGIAKLMFEFAVAWSRDFAPDLYNGNPSNNVGEGRKYFWGLDSLINTGYQDAITKQACPAADSLVFDFNGLDISAGTNGTTAVRRIVDLYRRLKEVAEDTRLAPVKWVLAMRRRLFWELTEVWPCAYNTYRCTPYWSSSQPLMNTPLELDAMRSSMRQGSYLLIDGEQVEVQLDSAIPEVVLPGATFESDIYCVPMTVLGGTPVTFMEHINYDAPYGAMEAARLLAPGESYMTSDGGRFLWHKKPPTNFCVQIMAIVEPRLLLLTPYVACRMINVRYTPLSHERDWNTNSSYFVDGGRTNFVGFGPSFWPPTA